MVGERVGRGLGWMLSVPVPQIPTPKSYLPFLISQPDELPSFLNTSTTAVGWVEYTCLGVRAAPDQRVEKENTPRTWLQTEHLKKHSNLSLGRFTPS